MRSEIWNCIQSSEWGEEEEIVKQEPSHDILKLKAK
jgi:hypothetical protein